MAPARGQGDRGFPVRQKKISGKIQWIYNGKCAPITMQGLAIAREKPPAQEQWGNEKNNGQSDGNSRTSGRTLILRPVISRPHKNKSPAAERRRAYKTKTRVSAIAHSSAERTLKSAPVIPASYRGEAAQAPQTSIAEDCSERARQLLRKSKDISVSVQDETLPGLKGQVEPNQILNNPLTHRQP